VNKFCFLVLLLLAVGITAATTSVGQVRSKPDSVTQVKPAPRIQADETFELNITEKHFTEENFETSTSVGLGTADSKRLSLQIGVALRARTIKVDLRNVTGTVRFRGSVQRILDLVQAREPKYGPSLD
jgi:hypothetical protein